MNGLGPFAEVISIDFASMFGTVALGAAALIATLIGLLWNALVRRVKNAEVALTLLATRHNALAAHVLHHTKPSLVPVLFETPDGGSD